MMDITRRDFLKSGSAAAVGAAALDITQADAPASPLSEVTLKGNWFIQSSALVDKGGETVSSGSFMPEGWYKASVPCTVLSALVKNGVYPDPRVGLNSYRIPDSSDEFNKKHDLAKYTVMESNRCMSSLWSSRSKEAPPTQRPLHSASER